ncbi:MAG: helix-hairpin-helix domain-containing protein [Desulfobacteraceae bacterium]|nr:helix-hairpin-helix domain-containing protein [Desulfobacteraceae bacterium]
MISHDKKFIILYLFGFIVLTCSFIIRSGNCSSSGDYHDFYLNWNGSNLETNSQHFQHISGNPEPACISPLLLKPIPINEAEQNLLMTIPGIGRKLSSEILHSKSIHGPFHSPKDLLRVKGIGSKRFLSLKDSFSYR